MKPHNPCFHTWSMKKSPLHQAMAPQVSILAEHKSISCKSNKIKKYNNFQGKHVPIFNQLLNKLKCGGKRKRKRKRKKKDRKLLERLNGQVSPKTWSYPCCQLSSVNKNKPCCRNNLQNSYFLKTWEFIQVSRTNSWNQGELQVWEHIKVKHHKFLQVFAFWYSFIQFNHLANQAKPSSLILLHFTARIS